MISDAEQRKLAEIEVALRRADPALARHFEKRSRTPRRRHVLAALLAVIAILVVSAVTAIAGVLGGAGTAVIVLGVMGGTGIATGLWRRRSRPSRRMR